MHTQGSTFVLIASTEDLSQSELFSSHVLSGDKRARVMQTLGVVECKEAEARGEELKGKKVWLWRRVWETFGMAIKRAARGM